MREIFRCVLGFSVTPRFLERESERVETVAANAETVRIKLTRRAKATLMAVRFFIPNTSPVLPFYLLALSPRMPGSLPSTDLRVRQKLSRLQSVKHPKKHP